MPAQGIPASQIADVLPGVLAAGGTGLDLVGLCLTDSTRVPIGQTISFSDPGDVAAYFGSSSDQAKVATTYFLGYEGASITPGSLIFAQYPFHSAVAPYLRGGPIGAQLSLAQLQAIAPGALGITINGVAYTSSSINLASATSFSNAATIIQTALGIHDAAFTAAIAEETASVTGSISGNVLSVSAVGSGTLVVGGVLAGTGVTANTQILEQITGTTGGVGTYEVSISQTVSSTTITEQWGQMTVSAVSAGTLEVGQVVAGAGVTAGSTILALGTGTGGDGTYVVPYQTVASESMTSGATTVTYDSVSEAFIILGGTPGSPGTITFATGAIATALLLTAATGAVISQGAPQASPVSFMTALWDSFQNFGTFFHIFNADAATALGFAQWENSLQTECGYIYWDNSVLNTEANQATNYAAIKAANLSGVFGIYAPLNTFEDAAMISGFVASIDFTVEGGRVTLAFLQQTGVVSEVNSASQATQLIANGMNFYGTYSTPSEGFTWVYPGQISGPYLWADSFFNACWLKNILQIAILQLYQAVGNIPFNLAGYTLITEALGGGPVTNGGPGGPIQQALNFGAIQKGVVLSPSEIAQLNNKAGPGAAAAVTNQGWYIQVTPATPAVRQARGPLAITFWYADGQSVQSISLQSVEVQ